MRPLNATRMTATFILLGAMAASQDNVLPCLHAQSRSPGPSFGSILRLRGGRTDRRRLRVSMQETESVSSPNLVAGEVVDSEQESVQTTQQDESGDGETTQRPEERENRSEMLQRSTETQDEAAENMSTATESGQADEEDVSEFLIRLRRSASPRGSLIATRIARLPSAEDTSSEHILQQAPGVGATTATRAEGAGTDGGAGNAGSEDLDADAVDGERGGERDSTDAGGNSVDATTPLWRLVFPDTAENDDASSSIFRRRPFRRRARRASRERTVGAGGSVGRLGVGNWANYPHVQEGPFRDRVAGVRRHLPRVHAPVTPRSIARISRQCYT